MLGFGDGFFFGIGLELGFGEAVDVMSGAAVGNGVALESSISLFIGAAAV
jgi:hypothetical protein